MRKLTASFFISLDGVVEAPDKWHFPYFNDVHPLVVGKGAKLFPDGAPPVKLELADSRTFSTGVVDLTYRPVAE